MDVFNIKLPSTEPMLQFIVAMQNIDNVYKGVNVELAREISLYNRINNGIYMKAEYAKTSYRIIEGCYSRYSRVLEDGNVAVNFLEIVPALREIDYLLFELGSILDLTSRAINISHSFGLSPGDVSFPKVVKLLEQQDSSTECTQHFSEFYQSELQRYFRKMRNRITHRLPFETRGVGGQLYFPDNPLDEIAQPSLDEGHDILETCKKWIYGILPFVDKAAYLSYGNIAKFEITNKKTGEMLHSDIKSGVQLSYDEFLRVYLDK